MRSKFSGLMAGLVFVALAGLPVTAQAAEPAPADPVKIAMRHLGVTEKTAKVTDLYTSDHNNVTHVYLRQLRDGTEVVGAEATVNIQRGKVIFSGSRFVRSGGASGVRSLDRTTAVAVATRALRSGTTEVTSGPSLTYQVVGNGRVRLVYQIEIETPRHWWHLSVDAENGRIVQRYDLIDSESQAGIVARTARTEDPAEAAVDPILPPKRAQDGSSYNVYAMPLESPNDGDRVVIKNPADAFASPFGWHDTDGKKGPDTTITSGNNVDAYADTQEDDAADPESQPDGGEGLDFDHPIPTFDATPFVYRDAAVDNLFYWNNVMHDVTYRYGFTEEAGNCQVTNYTKTGLGADAVRAEAQDGSGVLNANFATPVDGEPGRMQMFLWADVFDTLNLTPEDVVRIYSTQVRDGDLDGGVISHEYGHGVSNRLVGGPSNVSCLRTHDEREGEGWSDFWAYALTMRKGDDGATPRGLGTYVVYHEEGREGKGIRITPYSTDMKIDPATYDTIKTAAEPHGVGYVWASMLWDLYWNLVDKYGFNPNPYESWKTGGNNLAIQLVVDGMKFSVCQPGFEDARDAIIAADAALTGNPARGIPGDNECLIWKTFARRGLGVNANQGGYELKVDGKQGFKVPAHCEPKS